MELYANTVDESETVTEWFRTHPPHHELRILTGYFSFGSVVFLWSVLPSDITVRIVAQAEIKTARVTTAQLLASEAASFQGAMQDAGLDTDSLSMVSYPASQSHTGDSESEIAALKAVYDALGDSLQIRIHDDVHAKVYLTESAGLFGSSNLTRGGLERNIELNGTLDDSGYQTADGLFERCWDEADAFSDRLAQLLEASPVGRQLVDVPLSDRDTIQRAYGIVDDGVLDAVEADHWRDSSHGLPNRRTVLRSGQIRLIRSTIRIW